MDSCKSTDGIRLHQPKPKFKLVYYKDKSLNKYRDKLKERLDFKTNHPVKAFFMDVFGLLPPIEKGPSDWVVEKEEVL